MAAKMENVVIHTALTVSRWCFMYFNFNIYLRNAPYDMAMLSWLLVLVLERMMYLLSENIYTTIAGGDTVLTLASSGPRIKGSPPPATSWAFHTW